MRGAEYELHSNKEAFPQLLNEQVFMLQGGKLFRRDIIEEKQLYFPKQVVYGEDIRFNMQYFKYVNRYIVSDFPLFIYNIRQGREQAVHIMIMLLKCRWILIGKSYIWTSIIII